jgi:hypothetical protein
VYVVPGWSRVNVLDVSETHVSPPDLIGTPSLVTLYEMNGLSSVDDHASVMCLVPTLVTEKVGTVGGVLSSGSETLTVLLFADLFPAASTA